MGLKFDSKKAINDFIKFLEQDLSYAFITWKDTVESGLQHPFYKKNAYVNFELKRESNIIIAYLKANTYVLADSYGTGSLMLDDNPGFQKYRDSNYWNPSRKGKAITGRKSGTYTDIFGIKHTTSGKLEGINIEGMTFKGYTINPTLPSKAIQQAEQWLYKTYLPKAYQNTMKRMNFSKYLIEYDKK